MMKYVQIPDVSQPVSQMILGGSGERFASGTDVSDLMEGALACGINTVDTARVYRKSEEAIGRWIRSSGQREKIVIISKGCHPSMIFPRRVNEKAAEEDIRRSLDALCTDHIDVYLLHRDDESLPVGPIVDFLNRFHEEGRIGAFGGSNWTAKRVAEANSYARQHGLKGFSVTSPHYSLGRQVHDPWGNGCKTITGDQYAEERRFYQEKNMPVLAWSSLCSGVFSGKLKSGDWQKSKSMFDANTWRAYNCPDNQERLARCEQLAREKEASVSQIALAWLLCGELCAMPIISASGPARIIENVAAADIELSEKELAWLNLAGE